MLSNLIGPRFVGINGLEWGFDGQCSGECCRLITLNVTPERVAVLAAEAKYLRRVRLHDLPRTEAEFVAEEFVFVRNSLYDGVTGERRWNGRPGAQYRCPHWSGGKCGVYEQRPRFCKAYGLERTNLCHRPECSLRPYAKWHADDRWADDGGRVGGSDE